MNSEHVLIIAGEKSGEEHAKSFIEEVIAKRPGLKFYGVGGDYFNKLGFQLLYRIKDFAAMGFSDVLLKIGFYLKAYKKILREVDKRKTRYAILIDFQTFNLKLAGALKKRGVKVFYYVAPQAWAWKAWRAKSLQSSVEHLFCILPFEEKWFRDRGVKNITSMKHPLARKLRVKKQSSGEVSKILFLPGSRNSEVKFLLPLYVQFINDFLPQKKFELMLVKTSSVDQKHYEQFESKFDRVYDSLEIDEAFSIADFSIAASGTVTLDCALWGIPTIVCYKLSLLNDFVAGSLSYSGYVSLPNLVIGKEIFPELLREDCHPFLIYQKFVEVIKKREQIEKELLGLKELFETQSESPSSIILGAMK